MDILLDTHVFLWWLADDSQLRGNARNLISDSENMIYISTASVWEIAIMKTLGKLTVDADLEAVVIEEGFTTLPITFKHAAETQLLPPIHNDPFDRMLVAQARVETLRLLTGDPHILNYPANVISC